MTKRCLGCGALLQDKDLRLIGYTKDLTNDYCERCFKITHYNEKLDVDLNISNDKLLELINHKNNFVIFCCDFLNIYEENIDLFKRIKGPKLFLITKCDIIPKNIIKERLINNLKKRYKLDNILMCSIKYEKELDVIKNIIKDKKSVTITGPTNGGKSSLLNKLFNYNITVSNRLNTTLDFITLKDEGYVVYDTPGFLPNHYALELKMKKSINPRVFQLKNKYYLSFLEFNLASDIDNNITFYIDNDMLINKRKIIDKVIYDIKVASNSDLIIKGIGFINIKKECKISLNINKDLIEIRKTIIGK